MKIGREGGTIFLFPFLSGIKKMSKKILILNAPPRAGKDYLGNYLNSVYPNSEVVKFAEYLKLATHGLYGVIDSEGRIAPAHFLESVKDEPSDLFYGLTPRQAYIAVSERFFKVIYDKSFFGERLVEKIERSNAELFIVTDGGFVEEIQPLIDHFTEDNIKILHLFRTGCSFDNDSRDYIPSSNSITFYNTEEHFLSDVDNCLVSIINRWLEK